MEIKTFKTGLLETNTYVVVSDGEVLVVDPAEKNQEILDTINKSESFLRYILLTHGHFDHVLGLDWLKEAFPDANVVIGEHDVELVENVPEQGRYLREKFPEVKSAALPVTDGATLPFGETLIKVIETPGHTKGSVCFQIDDSLFSGDTLFYHTYGRIDLPYSEPGKMKESLNRLFELPEEMKVYPGHGRATNIKEEKNFYF